MTATHPTLPFALIQDSCWRRWPGCIARIRRRRRRDPSTRPASARDRSTGLIATAVFGEGAERDAARWIIRVAGAPALGAVARLHQFPLHGFRPRRVHPHHRAGHERAGTGLRHHARRLPRRPGQDCRSCSSSWPAPRWATRGSAPASTPACLAAAIKEGFVGPIFIQGDHYQVSAKKYAGGSGEGDRGLRDLIRRGDRRRLSTTSTSTPRPSSTCRCRRWPSSSANCAPHGGASPSSSASRAGGRDDLHRRRDRRSRRQEHAPWRNCTPS